MYISLVDADLPEECTEETVDTLFRIGEPDPARIALFTAAFDPPPIDGTEEALHSFWDHNIRKIIELLIPSESGKSPRNNKFNQLHTQTKKLHPDFGFLIKEVCLFRGEEKGMDCPGDPTRAELVDKLNWAYDPSPYILGKLYVQYLTLNDRLPLYNVADDTVCRYSSRNSRWKANNP